MSCPPQHFTTNLCYATMPALCIMSCYCGSCAHSSTISDDSSAIQRSPGCTPLHLRMQHAHWCFLSAHRGTCHHLLHGHWHARFEHVLSLCHSLHMPAPHELWETLVLQCGTHHHLDSQSDVVWLGMCPPW